MHGSAKEAVETLLTRRGSLEPARIVAQAIATYAQAITSYSSWSLLEAIFTKN